MSWTGKKEGGRSTVAFALTFVGTIATTFISGAIAQIAPDGTLGTESSVVTPLNAQSDRIDGGAIRGSNLFHSFQDFNVGDGRGAYFANPVGIDNILSRVTGSNPSNILGTLGVLGNANLYLLNPNGIFFGANAQLDIRGSFIASTADGIEFSDRLLYSATNLTAQPLLTVAVPIGLQYGTQPVGTITNAGNLTTGQNLTLSGSKLDLQGRLQASRDLTLQATDTVRIRDSVAEPFIAYAGGNLLIQGNQSIDILALNHPGTPFQSGGNLSLISDGIISGDAHFAAGGSFTVTNLAGELRNLVSLYDPTIIANGDISFSAYTGPSLQVIAGGSISVNGDITINAIDPSLDPTNFILTLQAGVPNAIDNVAFPFITSGTTFNKLPISPGNITVAGNISTTSNPMIVSLSAPGNIRTQAITSNGGSISISSSSGSINTGQGSLNSISNLGIGGEVTLDASGDIVTEFILTAPGGSADVADITLTSRNSSVFINNFDNNIFSVTGKSVTINAPGTVFIAGDLNARSDGFGGAGSVDIGNIAPLIPSSVEIGVISTRNLGGGNGGNIYIRTTGTLEITGALSRSAGRVVDPLDPNYAPDDLASIASEALGNGGRIEISADGGIRTAAGIVTNSQGVLKVTNSQGTVINTIPVAGNGGEITLNSKNGSISVNSGNIDSSAVNGSGGEIQLDAAGDVQVGGNILSTSLIGRGGDITLTSRGGVVNTTAGTTNASSIALNSNNEFDPLGNGGDVSFSSGSNLFPGAIVTAGLLGGNITLNSEATLFINDVDIGSGTISSNSGQSGNIVLNARTINLTSARVGTFTRGAARAGNILVGTTGTTETIILTDAVIGSPALGDGNSGNIGVTANQVRISNTAAKTASSNQILNLFDIDLPEGSGIATTTVAQGSSGSIFVDTNQLRIQDSSSVDRELTGISTASLTGSTGNVGNIKVDASESIELTGNEPGAFRSSPSNAGIAAAINNINTGITSATVGEGDAGLLSVTTGKLIIQNGAAITSGVSFAGSGNGTGLFVNAESIELRGKAAIATATVGAGDASDLTINARGDIQLIDGGLIAADTLTDKKAGNLTITADELTLTNFSRIGSATYQTGQGGTVTIDVANSIRLRNNSEITSEAFNTANGGDLNIKAGKLIFSPSFADNNDVVATAEDGQGGRVTAEAPGIFAFRDFNRVRTSESDFTATAASGRNGTVTPIDQNPQPPPPTQPTVREIPQVCPTSQGVATREAGRSAFINTGRGGLPPNPIEMLDSNTAQVPWVGLDPKEETSSNSSNSSTTMTATPDTIREAQGWMRLVGNKVRLTSNTSNLSKLPCIVQDNP
jgi:filamentous hemagglutinin family protein